MFTFLIGLSLILYPMISRAYYDTRYRKEAEQIRAEFNEETTINDNEKFEVYSSYNKNSITDLTNIEVADVGFISDENENNNIIDKNQDDVLGVLSIPKIDLTYAIRNGASDENLLNGVARIEGTSYPVGGLNTNSVIAGHRAQATKSFFARVPELENGDIIEIENQKETLYYEVFDEEIIEPTDTNALVPIAGVDMITLLTCTYPPPGTHRHLVFAKRTEAPDANKIIEETTDKQNTNKEASDSRFDILELVYMIRLFLSRYGMVILSATLGLYGFYFVYFRK